MQHSRKLATISTKLSSELYSEITQAWQEASAKLPEGAVLHYTIQPVASSSVQAGEDRGGNIMGLEKVPQTCKLHSSVKLGIIADENDF